MNFDYNISNYNMKDLEEIFELPDQYSTDNIVIKGNAIIEKVNCDPSVPMLTRTKTVDFIKQAINALSNFYQEKIAPNVKEQTEKQENIDQLFQRIYNVTHDLKYTPVTNDSGHIIQDVSPHPYTISSPSDTFAGTLNPLNRRTIDKNLNIDTRFRDNYFTTQSSDFYIDINGYFNEAVQIHLNSIEMPGTFYAVSKVFGNNYFSISITGLNPLVIIVPDGNYDYLSMENYLNYFLNQQSNMYSNLTFIADINTPNGQGAGGSGKMVVGISKTYIDNGGTPFNFTLDFATNIYGNPDINTPLPLKLGWMLGFRQGIYENNDKYVSEGLIDLVGPKYIFLVVDDYNRNWSDGFFSAFNNSVLNKNILARISLQGQNFHYISQNNLNLITTPRKYFGPVNLQKLHIQLLDEFGRVLDLNNMDFSFCLTVLTLYNL